MARTVFITGGSGMVGREIVARLLKQTDDRLILLVHEHEVLVGGHHVDDHRVTLVQGDITLPDCGLSAEAKHLICEQVTHILHGAASTRFDLPLEDARTINVTGTQRVAELAMSCRHLHQFGFLSTIYVSGKRTGTILEKELEHSSGFVNTYEQSKYEAELYLQKIDSLPTTVYRLSTVIGNSRDGSVTSFTAPHQALRMMYLGLASMVPGTPDYHVDLISSDYTAQTILDLFLLPFTPGRVYHVSQGADALELRELIDLSMHSFSEFDAAWAKRGYSKPLIVATETFDLFLKSAVSANNPVLRNVLTALGHFAHQLAYPKQFDQHQLHMDAPRYASDAPSIRSYYQKMIAYCIRTRWGKVV